MIVVDIETGGLDPVKNPILSIGAIDFDDPGNHFYGECRPMVGLEITDKALEVNGFDRLVVEQNTFTTSQLLAKFFQWVESLKTDLTIAGENPAFDRDFLKINAERFKLRNPFTHRTVDLHSVCYADMVRQGRGIPTKDPISRRNDLNADVIFVYTGIPAEPRPHNALNGAMWEAEAFSRLMRGKSMFNEFIKYPLDTHREYLWHLD